MFFRFLKLYLSVEFDGCVEANSTSLDADGWVPDFGGLPRFFGTWTGAELLATASLAETTSKTFWLICWGLEVISCKARDVTCELLWLEGINSVL